MNFLGLAFTFTFLKLVYPIYSIPIPNQKSWIWIRYCVSDSRGWFPIHKLTDSDFKKNGSYSAIIKTNNSDSKSNKWIPIPTKKFQFWFQQTIIIPILIPTKDYDSCSDFNKRFWFWYQQQTVTTLILIPTNN